MTRIEQDLGKLLKLGHDENTTINWCEEGGAEVFRIWDTWFLFEIPQYGGEGRFYEGYSKKNLEELLHQAYSWT